MPPSFSLADGCIVCLMVRNWVVQFHLTALTIRCYNLVETRTGAA
jgi:hypothetical protein